MLNLPKLQALAAPLSAPVPSALAIAAEAYLAVTPQTHWVFGWAAAIAAFIGIETVGGASCYALVKLHRQRQYGVEFIVALLGIGIYIGSGLYTLMDNPTIIFFFLAPFAYFAYSILRSMEAEIEEKTVETEAQIKLIEAQKRLTNAEVRKVKAEQTVRSPERTANTTEQFSVQQAIYTVLSERSDVGPREMARTVGCSVSTASKWIKQWKANNDPSSS